VNSNELVTYGNAPLRIQEVEDAVYGHIQAIRALGRDRITTTEIADALGLPHHIILEAVQHLRDKGIYPVS